MTCPPLGRLHEWKAAGALIRCIFFSVLTAPFLAARALIHQNGAISPHKTPATERARAPSAKNVISSSCLGRFNG